MTIYNLRLIMFLKLNVLTLSPQKIVLLKKIVISTLKKNLKPLCQSKKGTFQFSILNPNKGIYQYLV